MTLRRAAALAVFSTISSGLFIVSLSAAPPAAAPVPASRTIAEIVQDRVDLATRGYKLNEAGFRKGFINHKSLDMWICKRADAARDLPDVTQRIAILEESLAMLKQHAAAYEQAEKIGAAPPDDTYLAQDRVLECELWLAQARAAH